MLPHDSLEQDMFDLPKILLEIMKMMTVIFNCLFVMVHAVDVTLLLCVGDVRCRISEPMT